MRIRKRESRNGLLMRSTMAVAIGGLMMIGDARSACVGQPGSVVCIGTDTVPQVTTQAAGASVIQPGATLDTSASPFATAGFVIDTGANGATLTIGGTVIGVNRGVAVQGNTGSVVVVQSTGAAFGIPPVNSFGITLFGSAAAARIQLDGTARGHESGVAMLGADQVLAIGTTGRALGESDSGVEIFPSALRTQVTVAGTAQGTEIGVQVTGTDASVVVTASGVAAGVGPGGRGIATRAASVNAAIQVAGRAEGTEYGIQLAGTAPRANILQGGVATGNTSGVNIAAASLNAQLTVSGTATGAQHGVDTAGANARIDITSSGVVTAGTGAAIRATGDPGVATLVTSAGTINGGGQGAFLGNGGNETFNVTGGRVQGNATGGTGTDTFAISGGLFAGGAFNWTTLAVTGGQWDVLANSSGIGALSIASSGVINLAALPGVQTIQAQTYAATGGRLVVNADLGTLVADRIVVAGHADMGGTVRVVPAGAARTAPGEYEIPIVQAASYTSTFSAIEGMPSYLLVRAANGSIFYRNMLTDPPVPPSQCDGGTGRYLQSTLNQPGTSPLYAPAVDAALANGGNPGVFGAQLDALYQTSAGAAAGLLLMGENARYLLGEDIYGRLRTLRRMDDRGDQGGGWVDVKTGRSTQNGTCVSGNNRLSGVHLGVDTRPSDGPSRVGGSFAYYTGHNSTYGISGGADNYFVNGYAQHVVPDSGWFGNLWAGYGRNNYTNGATGHADSYIVDAGVGRRFVVSQAVLEPQVRFAWYRTSTDGAGVGSGPLAASNIDGQWQGTQLMVGLQAAGANPGERGFVPEGTVFYYYRPSGDVSLSTRLAGAAALPASLTYDQKYDRQGLMGTLGGTGYLRKNLSASLHVFGRAGQDERSWGALAGVRYDF